MNERNVFLLKEHYRIVGTDGRISGNWHVLLDDRRGTAWITPHDVTIYDEARRSGVILRGDAFTAGVTDAGVSLRARGHRFEHDIEEVRPEMEALLARIAVVAWADQRATQEPTEQES